MEHTLGFPVCVIKGEYKITEFSPIKYLSTLHHIRFITCPLCPAFHFYLFPITNFPMLAMEETFLAEYSLHKPVHCRGISTASLPAGHLSFLCTVIRKNIVE